MSTGLIEIIKVAAMEAIENSKPCDVRSGTVVSVSPLKIQISPNLILPESVLIVPRRLTDYNVKCDIGSASNLELSVVEKTLVIENKDVNEEDDSCTITIYNSLVVGDKVTLIREQGGKYYHVLDKV